MGSSLALCAAAAPLGGHRRPVDPFAGCSVSLWLRPLPTAAAEPTPLPAAETARAEAKPVSAERCRCHVLSVGAAGQLTELWLERGHRLVVRRTESSQLTCRSLCELALSAAVATSRWSHLAFRLVPNGEVMTVSEAPGGRARLRSPGRVRSPNLSVPFRTYFNLLLPDVTLTFPNFAVIFHGQSIHY